MWIDLKLGSHRQHRVTVRAVIYRDDFSYIEIEIEPLLWNGISIPPHLEDQVSEAIAAWQNNTDLIEAVRAAEWAEVCP
jgi:hypothetical protein